MSLDISLYDPDTQESLWEGNITYNLSTMAEAANLYNALWHPEEIGAERAGDLIPFLLEGITRLALNKRRFTPFNPENGWGNYENLLLLVVDYLAACQANPYAEIGAHS